MTFVWAALAALAVGLVLTVACMILLAVLRARSARGDDHADHD
jgi:hypothetical protein